MSSDFASLPQQVHSIPLDKAIELTRRFRESSKSLLQPPYSQMDVLATCETFNKDPIVALAATPGCAGIRIYYGMSDDFKMHGVLVAVNSNGEDILPVAAAPGVPAQAADILDDAMRCPTLCPPASPLNS